MPDPTVPAASVNPDPAYEHRAEAGADVVVNAIRNLRPSPLSAGLYLTAMPIGNAEDVTLRALRVLSTADVIACEDTRHSGRLLARYGIATPLVPYHEHNAERMRPQLLSRMSGGEVVALISDAGTPLISDPGYKLVRDSVSRDIAVTSVPGASAAPTALVLSGLPTDRFLFAGFPPSKAVARGRFLETLNPIGATLIFFESAHRLADSLAAMAATLGDREAAVARELTKRFEEVRRGALSVLAEHYVNDGPPKGEIVIVVGPPDETAPRSAEAALDPALRDAFADGQSLRDVVDRVATATGRPRREVYARALLIRDGEPEIGGEPA